MTRIRLTVAALTLLVAGATLTAGCANEHGCILVAAQGAPVPDDWWYDEFSGIWWDPEDGFIGFSTTEDAEIWNAIPGVSAEWCSETGGGV